MSHKTFINTKGKTPDQIASEVMDNLSLDRQATTAAAKENLEVIGPVITPDMAKEDPEGCAQSILQSFNDFDKLEAMRAL